MQQSARNNIYFNSQLTCKQSKGTTSVRHLLESIQHHPAVTISTSLSRRLLLRLDTLHHLPPPPLLVEVFLFPELSQCAPHISPCSPRSRIISFQAMAAITRKNSSYTSSIISSSKNDSKNIFSSNSSSKNIFSSSRIIFNSSLNLSLLPLVLYYSRTR